MKKGIRWITFKEMLEIADKYNLWEEMKLQDEKTLEVKDEDRK